MKTIYIKHISYALMVFCLAACQQNDSDKLTWPDKDSNSLISNSNVLEKQLTYDQQQRSYLLYVPTSDSEIEVTTPTNQPTTTPRTTPSNNSNDDSDDDSYDSIYPYSYKRSAEDALPLLMVFHGFGMTAEQQLAMADFTSLAQQHQFIVVYPQGALLDGSPHWNAALAGGDNKSSVDDFGFISALLQHLQQQYSIDSRKVYATGYSNGGFFAFALACLYNEQYAAIATMSSTMLDSTLSNCSPTHATSVMVWHDSQDTTVTTSGSDGYASIESVLEYWKNYNQTQQNQTYTHNNVTQQIASAGINDSEVQLLQTSGQGHVWIDSQINQQSTNELIWQFLSRFSLEP